MKREAEDDQSPITAPVFIAYWNLTKLEILEKPLFRVRLSKVHFTYLIPLSPTDPKPVKIYLLKS